MSNILNAVKNKIKSLKQNRMARTVLISVLVLVLIVSATLAWYINNMELWGMEFNTGNIDFDAYVFDASGKLVAGPVSSNAENESSYINAPLISISNAQVGSTGTAYIAVESTGSLGIQYRMIFDVAGKTENSTAYLGGYKYNISKVTDKLSFDGAKDMDVSGCPAPQEINDEMVTIDRNAVNGVLEEQKDYDIYRLDYTLVHKNEEYTGSAINIYFNIMATQIDGEFDEGIEKGNVYYCSTREDIDRVRIEAYPGDTIKLSSDIVYYGDLVFNKPINLETNDFTLTVNGNLMYDYALGNSLKLDAGGLGKIVVQCTKEGVGGNLQIKAPLSDVSLIGSNASVGDIVVEKNIIIDATNSFGSAGVSFNDVRIVDLKNQRKIIQLESNTRATVSFGTSIGTLQSVVKANNIEIVNNGEIGEINLSNMYQLGQTNYPQIYILNNNNITNPIMLPSWSVKFQEDEFGVCTGNTRIIQSYSGSTTTVTGNCDFTNADVEVERIDFLVQQIEEGNDSRLRIYYQDLVGQTTTIQSILENYLANEATTGCAVYEVIQLEIVSVGDKAVTSADIAYMNGNDMRSLRQLDMQRANICDTVGGTYNKLPNDSFKNVTKYESLILPQNLEEIGTNAFYASDIENVITVPSGVTVFGSNWFYNGNYVRFAASVPILQATNGLSGVQAIFVDEAYIASYKSVYSSYATRIYPVSVMDETKTHFVRNTKGDDWEITYLISGNDPIIGANIAIDGTTLKITSVYDNAYRHNFTGTVVKFTDSVENLGAGNFYNNKNIVEADLNNIKYIGANAFYAVSGLPQVTFGRYVEVIGENAFYNCTNMKQDVILPETMQTIGASAFRNTKITGINTGGATSVDGYAFAYCAELIYAELPNVNIVGENGTNYLFSNDSKLVSVKIPMLKTAAGENMFEKCTSLREVYMSVKDEALTLGTKTFNGCDTTRLKLFVPEEHIDFYRSNRPGGIAELMIYPQGEKLGEELVNGFNIGVFIISDNSDGTCTLVTSNVSHEGELVIPETFNGKSITRIYANAFRNQSFTNVTVKLGNNIKVIGDYAFYNLKGLVGVEFGNSLEEIGSYAFGYCSNMVQDVNLPDTMQSIASGAFRETGILSLNTGGTISIESYAFHQCRSLVYAIMPEVTTIAESGTNYAFQNCSALVSVNIPKLYNVSGTYLFAYCSSLSEVYMASDNSGVSLGGSPFMSVSKNQLKLFVPESLVSTYKKKGSMISSNQVYPIGEKMGDYSVNGFVIGDYIVMDNDSGYTLVASHLSFSGEVVIPNEYKNKPITEVYEGAFRNQSFTDATIVFGNNLKIIGSNAFYNASGLSGAIIDGVTTINGSAFYGTGIHVLNGLKLTSIGSSAFAKCTNLELVNLPKIETITSSDVFANCTSLKTVYFEKVKSLKNTTFSSDNALEKITINRVIAVGEALPTATIPDAAPCKIYVPYLSLAAYGETWCGKPVVTFDISATGNGDTFILSDNNGKYTLIDFIPGQSSTELVIPDTVYSTELGDISIHAIRNGALSTVSSTVKTVTLSSTVAQLGGEVLRQCILLENIYVDGGNAHYSSINGVLYSKDGAVLVQYPLGRSGAFDMSDGIYSSTVAIGANAFTNATGLTEIKFSASLMIIDGSAFAYCPNLVRVEFTGATPPTLMGVATFDTAIEDFVMIVPESALTTYVNAYNFGEYLEFINREV